MYSSTYSAAPSPSWSTPAALASPGWATPSTPALAPGVGGAQAEMVFIDASNGAAEHARYGATWSAPSAAGGTGLAAVGAASM